ncbi:MAG TPA: acetyl-CoA carboxylase biotin carboxylase subunit, partial [Bacteroidetes bacterium]|nr:acetyl-CoA carboxylase biotin carboxylase subunit [Bacteroidota bacterium]
RKHQKLVEESPSPAVDAALRKRMEEAAVLAARTVNYRSAGTIEFLLDQNGDFYFMEMNTRIQVEHPVTEMVTGTDLVKQQILVAAGEKLDESSLNHTLSGHAIECRINAEDPEHNFRPSPGKIESLHFPGGPGIRVDSHVYAQYVIPPFYDSLIAKVIAHGRTRDEAIRRMQRALEEFVVEGIKTTIPLHQRILASESFQAGDLDTSFLARLEEEQGVAEAAEA